MKIIKEYILKFNKGLGFLLLISGYNLSAQRVTLNNPEQRFISNIKEHYQEKIFLHTDKTLYLAGEILWFRVYHLDAISNKESNLSKVAYVELMDQKNKPVLQAKVSLKRNEDNGSFQLPVGIATGYYFLRAYTSNMKNAGEESFFEKQLTIINTLQNPKQSVKDSSANYFMHLFPEGGNLVKGINSRIAFKVTDKYGKGVSCKGYIIRDRTDTILNFKTLRFGMGNFYFTPFQNSGYKAVAVLPDGEFIYVDMPAVFDHGFTFQATEDDSAHVKLLIHTNLDDRSVYLMAANRKEISIMQSIPLSAGVAQVIIDKSRLGEGITRLTLMNTAMEPLCERLFFIRPQEAGAIKLNSDKGIYGKRQKVRLELSERDTAFLLNSSLSLSVCRIDSVNEVDPENMTDYLWLTSELKGNIESPSYYFTNDKDLAEATENLLLTQGWRRFRWEDESSMKTAAVNYPLEYNGHIITAKITDIRTGLAAEGIQAFLSVPGSGNEFYTGESNQDGLVRFDVSNYYGQGEIIVQLWDKIDSFHTVQVQNPFFESNTSQKVTSVQISPAQNSALENYSISMQVQKIYKSDSINHFLNPVIKDTLPFYGRASHSYNLDDYTRFTTMEEVLREYVSEINVGAKGGRPHIKLLNETEKLFYENEALVMIDGIPMMNVNKIFSIDPLTIKKLDVIPRNYIVGPSSFPGIANFITYSGKGEGFELDSRGIIIDYDGLQVLREFYSPEYNSPLQVNSRLPDFRNTLFWSPDVLKIRKYADGIDFYTSDVKGTYLVSLQGIQKDGKAVSTYTKFEVN